MLRGVTNFVRRLYGDDPFIADLEAWAKQSAELATPDDLIAASVIQLIAADFSAWKLTGSFEPQRRYEAGKPSSVYARFDPAIPVLKHREKDIEVKFVLTRDSYSLMHATEPAVVLDECSVNGTKVDTGQKIKDAWDQISAKVKAAEAAAAQAKADMEANERKWNLTEKLLGMKRNEFGALVPIETAS